MIALTHSSFEQRVSALRRRADERKVPWQQAGEELLIEHKSWIQRDDFCAKAMAYDGEDDEATILWEPASEILADAMTRAGAPADLVVLAFAVALGTDRYQLSHMDDDGTQQTLAAVAAAVQDWTVDEH